MTFDSDERSIQDGSPIELYQFVGTYTTWRLTNADTDQTNAAGTWDSTYAIKRTSLEEGTQEDDDISLDLQLHASHPMIADYAINEPPPALTMTLFRAHPADLDDTITLFTGEVISWKIEGRIAKIRVPSLFSFLFNGPLPPVKYQGPCNHKLGSTFCGVDMTSAANSQDTTISTISGNTVTTAVSQFADGTCVAGELIAGDERRMITANVGTTFTIASPFSAEVVATDAVTIRQGCDHSLNGSNGCAKFSNWINFGGFPYVPNRNPYAGRI